jgi:hypothetical protein
VVSHGSCCIRGSAVAVETVGILSAAILTEITIRRGLHLAPLAAGLSREKTTIRNKRLVRVVLLVLTPCRD